MNTKLLIFTLTGTFYFSLMPMNKQKVSLGIQTTGNSIIAAASAALIAYSLIQIPNQDPLNTLGNLISGLVGVRVFGKDAYNNIMLWQGKNHRIEFIKSYILEMSDQATQKTLLIIEKLASASYFDYEVDLTPQDGSEKIPATLRVKNFSKNPNEPTTEMLVEYLKQPIQSSAPK